MYVKYILSETTIYKPLEKGKIYCKVLQKKQSCFQQLC